MNIGKNVIVRNIIIILIRIQKKRFSNSWGRQYIFLGRTNLANDLAMYVPPFYGIKMYEIVVISPCQGRNVL